MFEWREREENKSTTSPRLSRMMEKDAMVAMGFLLSLFKVEEYENREREREGEKKENSGLKMEDG